MVGLIQDSEDFATQYLAGPRTARREARLRRMEARARSNHGGVLAKIMAALRPSFRHVVEMEARGEGLRPKGPDGDGVGPVQYDRYSIQLPPLATLRPLAPGGAPRGDLLPADPCEQGL